jgi:hypothetical protein
MIRSMFDWGAGAAILLNPRPLLKLGDPPA